MSAASWLETKQLVREATDIVELVGRYMQLRRQGRVFVGLCPWHDDTRPSLQVNPDRQSFKCWVCDVGGDVFSFLMRMEGVEFREALGMLAERAGVPLQLDGPARPKPQPGSPDDKRTLQQAMAWAENEYQQCLAEAPAAEPARKYLEERGITQESVARFHIGFSPDRWDWLLARAGDAGFSPAVLEKVGLVVPRSSGDGYYDRFRGRLMFSIRDAQAGEARPIAFGGRILPELASGDAAKYINSPETPLFSKSRQLYGLDIAKDEIQRQRNVVVVEGYTDCVMAHQCGLGNVVAVLGTALGERHVVLLRRLADSITLVLDGDEAGQRRANEILQLFVAEQVDLKILTLPQNVDPCDFLRAQGSEAFGQLLAAAVDAIEHKIRTVTKGLDLTADTHQANTALEELLATLAKAPRLASQTPSSARLREHQVLARLAREFRVAEEQLRTRLTELRRRVRKPAVAPDGEEPAPAAAPESVDAWDRELLEILLSDPRAIGPLAAEVEPNQMRLPACRAIYAKCVELYQAGVTPDFDRLMLEAENPATKNLLVELEQRGRAKAGSDPVQRLQDLLHSFQNQKEDAEHSRQIAELQQGKLEPAHEEQVLNQLFASLKTRQSRSAPTEG